MKYKFKVINLWEELNAILAGVAVNVKEDGNEIIFDFDENVLTAAQEVALKNLMATKPMLRGKLAKFVGKGLDIEITLSR